jgi:hypothetical protein
MGRGFMRRLRGKKKSPFHTHTKLDLLCVLLLPEIIFEYKH